MLFFLHVLYILSFSPIFLPSLKLSVFLNFLPQSINVFDINKPTKELTTLCLIILIGCSRVSNVWFYITTFCLDSVKQCMFPFPTVLCAIIFIYLPLQVINDNALHGYLSFKGINKGEHHVVFTKVFIIFGGLHSFV